MKIIFKRLVVILIVTALPVKYLFSQINNAQDYFIALRKSYNFEKTGNYLQSISAIENIAFPEDYLYLKFVRLGWLNYLNGNYNNSIYYYSSAVKLDPHSLEAKEMLMTCYYLIQEYTKAEKMCRKILRLYPSNYTARYKLAELALINLNYPEAEFHLEKIIKQTPTDYATNQLLLTCYRQQLNQRKAKAINQRLTLLYPGDKK